VKEKNMPAVVRNLWPNDFGQEETLAPVAILRQQGNALGERTQNIIIGRVNTHGNAVTFLHDFILFCPPLAYQVPILRVQHQLEFYPATITPDGQEPVTAADPDDFSDKLAKVFASEKVKKIIRSLLAQSQQ
jgi:hypothetical protein